MWTARCSWSSFLEFVVPRIGSRLDVALISGPVIFAIEFKVGESAYRRADINQVWDYALDLKNFHKGSHEATIVPILVATEATWSDTALLVPHADGVYPPCRCNADGLAHLITEGLAHATGRPLDATAWDASPYQPTPTIIEAARSLYARHTVHDITRSDAGAVNLAATSGCIERIIAAAKAGRRKAIVFVTGVPGAGKTLVGLNVATRHGERSDAAHAVFLSGNGPLVAVLREALRTRDPSVLVPEGWRGL